MVIRRAFTLIELLVVISIIAVLAGLTVAAVAAIRRSAKAAHTATILATVRVGLETTGAERGGVAAGVPHPFANSLGTRLIWRRIGSNGYAADTDVATTGEALTVPVVASLATTAIDRVLLPDDRFADASAPRFVGLPRRSMNILGSAAGWVRVRRMPAVGVRYDLNEDGILDEPYDHTKYNDNVFLEYAGSDKNAGEIASLKAIEYALGASALTELNTLGGLRTNTDQPLMMDDRIRAAPADDKRTDPPSVVLTDGTWPYDLRGSWICDAWGREVLYEVSADQKSFVLLSAGEDGWYCSNDERPRGGDDNVVDGRRK